MFKPNLKHSNAAEDPIRIHKLDPVKSTLLTHKSESSASTESIPPTYETRLEPMEPHIDRAPRRDPEAVHKHLKINSVHCAAHQCQFWSDRVASARPVHLTAASRTARAAFRAVLQSVSPKVSSQKSVHRSPKVPPQGLDKSLCKNTNYCT